MRVLAFPADEGGCGAYRVRWPAAALAAQGHDVTLQAGLPGRWVDRRDGTPELVGMDPVDADVVVLQRPLGRDLARAIPHLQAQGIAVVVEIDDDFSSIPPQNVSWKTCHPRNNPHRNWDHLAAACRAADLVTVTTPALARRYGNHGRVAVIPNFVPEWYLQVRQPKPAPPTIGWTGSVATHPGDLEVTHGAVARVVAETGCRFAVVGTGVGVGERLGLDADPPGTGWCELEAYPYPMAAFDVGIVPLADTAFNAAKSCLKLMEFAALGVPAVASPTADNLRLHAHGVGLIARRPRDWVRGLHTLLGDEDLRAEMAAHGRAAVAGLTIEANADRWWDAWRTAAHQSARRKVAA